MLLMAEKRQIVIPTPEQVRNYRGKLTQVEAAALIGVTQGQWSAWEKGLRPVPPVVAIAMKKTFCK